MTEILNLSDGDITVIKGLATFTFVVLSLMFHFYGVFRVFEGKGHTVLFMSLALLFPVLWIVDYLGQIF